MPHRLASPLALAGVLLGLLAATVTPAAALSCAAPPDGAPAAVASGTWDDFFEEYDFAAIGTVVEIRTVEAPGPEHGATTLTVDVVAVLGDDAAPPRLEISSSDPGWMAGYPYEAGASYFIPVQATGPGGQPNFSFLCDPITEVDVGIAPELRRLADDARIPFSTPEVAQGSGPAEEPEQDAASGMDGPASSDSGRPAAALVLLWGLVLVVAAGVTVFRARRRAVPPSSVA